MQNPKQQIMENNKTAYLARTSNLTAAALELNNVTAQCSLWLCTKTTWWYISLFNWVFYALGYQQACVFQS